MKTIAVLGTLDSKGHEHQFVADINAFRDCVNNKMEWHQAAAQTHAHTDERTNARAYERASLRTDARTYGRTGDARTNEHTHTHTKLAGAEKPN